MKLDISVLSVANSLVSRLPSGAQAPAVSPSIAFALLGQIPAQ